MEEKPKPIYNKYVTCRLVLPQDCPDPICCPKCGGNLVRTKHQISYSLSNIIKKVGDNLNHWSHDYTYNKLSSVTIDDGENSLHFQYAYDAVGNRLSQTTPNGTVNYIYDAANRLTNANGQTYTWDDNGNLLNDGTLTYSYNSSNQLIGITSNGKNIAYRYSGLGDRLQQINNGVTTNYTLDINTDLTQILQDGTNTYLYGNGRIAQVSPTQTGYFLPDVMGSVRQMVDPNGAIQLARSYDPYGNVLSSNGTGTSMYGFDGEQQDGYINLINLRARQYSSESGRFFTKDVWEGKYTIPLSYNPYLFGYSNPVEYSDPSGFIAESESKTADDIVNRLQTHEIYINKDWGYTYQNPLTFTPTPITISLGSVKNSGCWNAGSWDIYELKTIEGTINDFVSDISNSTFKKLFSSGGITFKMSKFACGRGCTYYPYDIEYSFGTPPTSIDKSNPFTSIDKWSVAHELGHWADYKSWNQFSNHLVEITGGEEKNLFWSPDPSYCDMNNAKPGCNTSKYFYGGQPPKGSDVNFNPREDFAESVAAYLYPDVAEGVVKNYKGTPLESFLFYDDYKKTTRGIFIKDLFAKGGIQ
jgi:RHS repeat-associated protein